MVITTFKQNSDLYVGATNTAHNPFIFNRPPTLEHLRTLFEADPLPDLALQHALGGRRRGRHHPRARRARRLQPGPAHRTLGRAAEHRDLPHLPRAVDAAVHPVLAPGLAARAPEQPAGPWSSIYPTFTVPFCTWLLMGFFKSLPKEVEESAMVDGCSRVGAIWRMVLPLVGARPPHRGHLRPDPGDPGVRLQPDLHLVGRSR